jgi:hypothetical protein
MTCVTFSLTVVILELTGVIATGKRVDQRETPDRRP